MGVATGDTNNILIILKQIKSVFFDDVIVDFKMLELQFKNYRLFYDEEFKLSPRSTVFIGKNGSGKTSVLEGLTVAIGGFLSGINEATASKTISSNDVRVSSYEDEGAVIFDPHPPSRVELKSHFIHEEIEWSRARNSLTSTKITSKDANPVTNIVRQLVEDIRNGESRKITLPVFSYHGTGRVANFTRDMGLLKKTEKISRFMAYKGCLNPASNYKFFLAWYRKMKFNAFEFNRVIPSLDAVTGAIVRCLRELTEDPEERSVNTIRFLEGQIHVEFTSGEIEPITRLSDGYQDVIGIVSDIAYRMAILNPHLGEKVTVQSPGIVLIDEVELHLHPRWQQRILGILKTIFPLVQFITTTHSPIVISATEREEAIELIYENGRIKAVPVGNPHQWFISDILEQVFHITKMPLYDSHEVTDNLDEQLLNLSNAVKDYLAQPNQSVKLDIEQMYQRLLPSLPESSPRRRAVEHLMGLVQ